MTKITSNVLSFGCAVVVCAAAGSILGSWVSGPFADQLAATRDLGNADHTLDASDQLVDTSERFVQEPGRRTSRRPIWPTPRDINKRGNSLMLQMFEDVIANSVRSTVQLSVRGTQVALGAIVDGEGWIATKASQLPSPAQISSGRRIVCKLSNGEEYPATVEAIRQDIDVAVLRIQANRLPAVDWELDVPARGNWLATTDLYSLPAAVGVASAGLQTIEKSRAVLGVILSSSSNGARVQSILPTSGASEAGLQEQDDIISVNGFSINSHDSFLRFVKDGYGGQTLDLVVLRGERKLQVTARLMDLSEELLDETEMEVSGQISHRATGFDRVLMHDTVLHPNQCGGPIVNLDGKVIGLNIARAGRVSTYALPSSVVQPIISGLVEQAKLVSRSTQPAPETTAVR